VLLSAESQVWVIWTKSGHWRSTGSKSGFCGVSPDCRKVDWSKAQFVQSEGHPRGGISPKRSSIESGTELAFALVQVGDLLGADIGPRGRDRTETGAGQSSGVQVNRWIRKA